MTAPSRFRISAGVAGVLGLLTIVAGGRVLLGGNPGYVVMRPVLLFNVVMGAIYLVAALLMFRASSHGSVLAWFIAEANLVVLIGVVALRLLHQPVATQTLAAMAFRTGAWFLILWLVRSSSPRRLMSL